MSTPYPIFIISLDDAEQRRQPLLDQLAEQGLEWQVFPAVDARTGVPEEYEPLIDRENSYKRMRREMSNGEYGCALSHRSIYQKIVAEHLPGAVILEDDAILHPHFGDFLRAGDAASADMVIFDYLRASVSRWRDRTATHGVKLHQMYARSTRTTGYALSQKAAQKMLAATTPISHAADWPCDLYRVGAWVTFPKLIGRPDDEAVSSTIEGDRAQLYSKAIRKSPLRYFKCEYWRKKIAKRVG